MSDSILQFINHYKKSIEKNSEDRDRILHCLTRLAKLKVSVGDLQQTGIGKTVNNVRKLEGEVGELAKTLVMKWKDMVAADEKAEKAKAPPPLFSLPIKLEKEDSDEPRMEIFKSPEIAIKEENRENHKKSSSSSSSSSHSSKNKSKSDHHHHNSSRSSDKKDEHRKSSSSKHSSSSKGSEKSKHHHKSHHSNSSHSENSSKRKHEESSKENESSHKKPKLEIKAEIKKESSKPSSSSKSSSKHKEKPKKVAEVSQDEMDGSGGMGFAEALALFDMPSTSSKKKEVPLPDKITKVPSTSKSSSSSSPSKPKDSFKKPSKSLTAPPKLLVQKPKLEPLPDIVNDLPSDVSIPEYRPAPLNAAVKDYINSSVLGSQYMRPQPRNQSDAELLTESFSSKANRTRVFSGNRVQKSVPSLFEMCIRVLQENIDFLTETGGVPFDILRPVLERAKPDQLTTIEYYNSYLLDESDVLWEPHCKRKFRTRQREEMETWREMYERCTREDEEKLSRLTRNIKQQQEKADGGVQKTMLAYVDTVAKAPRNVRHKQEIFGTNHKLVVSPAMRTVGLRNLQPNLAAPGDARLRVSAGLRDDAQQTVGRRQVKHAPMMAKILSKFKR